MNIDDVKAELVPEDQSLLPLIFEKQRELMKKYDPIEEKLGFKIPESTSIDDRFVQHRIKDFFWRTTEEIAEAMENPPPDKEMAEWKTEWDTNANLRHFYEELADALHFLVEASIIADFYPDDYVYLDACEVPLGECLKCRCFNFIRAMGLAANCLKNKPWKQSQMVTDQVNFSGLLYEAWTQFMMLWIFVGGDLGDLYVLYCKKNEVNQFRQRSNY